jgi:hypothetical protein
LFDIYIKRNKMVIGGSNARKKAIVYNAIRNWIQYRKMIEKKYVIHCMIHDICIYCNEPLDTKQFCETCEPELHDLYYMRERDDIHLKINLY